MRLVWFFDCVWCGGGAEGQRRDECAMRAYRCILRPPHAHARVKAASRCFFIILRQPRLHRMRVRADMGRPSGLSSMPAACHHTSHSVIRPSIIVQPPKNPQTQGRHGIDPRSNTYLGHGEPKEMERLLLSCFGGVCQQRLSRIGRQSIDRARWPGTLRPHSLVALMAAAA